MKQALRESLWLPGMALVGGLAVMVMLLQAASGAPLGRGPQASYPPPSSPCTYVPIIGINNGSTLAAQVAAAYPAADAQLAFQASVNVEAPDAYPAANVDASQAQAGADGVQVSPAAYPPPSSPCTLRNKFLYTPIIRNNTR